MTVFGFEERPPWFFSRKQAEKWLKIRREKRLDVLWFLTVALGSSSKRQSKQCCPSVANLCVEDKLDLESCIELYLAVGHNDFADYILPSNVGWLVVWWFNAAQAARWHSTQIHTSTDTHFGVFLWTYSADSLLSVLATTGKVLMSIWNFVF